MATAVVTVGGVEPARADVGDLTTFAAPNEIDAGREWPRGGIAAGPDGNLWVASPQNDRIARITPSGVITTFGAPDVDRPTGITLGPDGALWFTSTDNDRIGRITPAGTITTFTDPQVQGPTSIVAGADGDLWFNNLDGLHIGRFDPGTSAFSTVTDEGIDVVVDLTAGPDGNVWFTATGADRVGYVTPAGEVTTFAAGVSNPEPITAGPDGNLWYAGGGQLARVTPAGAVTVLSGFRPVRDLAAGPDGNLWILDYNFDRLGRVTPAGSATYWATPPCGDCTVGSIAAGPDGNLWYTLGDKVIRATTAGAQTAFDDGLEEPSGLTVGVDGDVWFAAPGNDTLGHISESGAITTTRLGLGANLRGPIATGSDGNFWLAEENAILRVTPAGVTDRFTSPFVADVRALTAGPDGNVWFGTYGSQRVGRITPEGSILTFPVGESVYGITAGGDGALWFTTYAGLGRVTTVGQVTFESNPAIGNPGVIAGGPDGSIWFAQRDNTPGVPKLARRAPDGTFHGAPLTGVGKGIALDAAGNAWVLANGHSSGEQRRAYLNRVTPGGTRTVFTDPDLQGTWASNQLQGVVAGTDGAMWMASQVNDRIVRVDTGLAPPGALSGVVTGPDGPLARAWVAVVDASTGRFLGGRVTDVAGHYHLPAPNGIYVAEVIDPSLHHAGQWYDGHAYRDLEDADVVEIDGPTTWNPVLAAGGNTARITGTVGAEPVGGATVGADPLGGVWVAAVSTTTVEVVGGASSAADGTFEIAGLAPDRYLLVFLDPTGVHVTGYGRTADDPNAAERIDLVPGESVDVDRLLGPAPALPPATATLTGRVTSEDDAAPIEDAWVGAVGATGFFVAGTSTDASGAYSLGVPPGTYRMVVIDPSGGHRGEWVADRDLDHVSAADPVTVTGGGTVTVDAALEASGFTAAIEGTITGDKAPSGLARAWVAAVDSNTGGLAGGALTDAQGGYRITGLRTGTYWLIFADPTGAHHPDFHPTGRPLVPVGAAAGTTTTADVRLAAR